MSESQTKSVCELVDTVANASRLPDGDHAGCVGTSGPGKIVMVLLPDSITTTEAERPVVYASLYVGTDDAGGSVLNCGPVESELHATAAMHRRACTGIRRRVMKRQSCILSANEGWSVAAIQRCVGVSYRPRIPQNRWRSGCGQERIAGFGHEQLKQGVSQTTKGPAPHVYPDRRSVWSWPHRHRIARALYMAYQ